MSIDLAVYFAIQVPGAPLAEDEFVINFQLMSKLSVFRHTLWSRTTFSRIDFVYI